MEDKEQALVDAAAAVLREASIFRDQWGPDERAAYQALQEALEAYGR